MNLGPWTAIPPHHAALPFLNISFRYIFCLILCWFLGQGLLLAHDRLAFREALPSDEEAQEMESEHDQPRGPQQAANEYMLVEEDNMKIVRIDKATEPLGATVKNAYGSVTIGRIVKGGAADKCGKERRMFFNYSRISNKEYIWSCDFFAVRPCAF